VGESARNQFYPRCGLGDEWDRERWVAAVGPGEVEVARVLMAEFESMASPYGSRLLEAKARVIAEAHRTSSSSRQALAALVAVFLAEVDAFINLHATAIAATGMATDALSAAIARAFVAWQSSARLDLPSIADNWIPGAAQGAPRGPATTVAVPGLSITTSLQTSEVRLVGQIDESNLTALTESLDAAVSARAAVTVDLSGVTFCSLGGLRNLAIGAACGELRLAGVPTHLDRTLAAAGLAAECVA
jgi:anti-anti-sigma regulatory factor